MRLILSFTTLFMLTLTSRSPHYLKEFKETVIHYKDPEYEKHNTNHLSKEAYKFLHNKTNLESFEKQYDFIVHHNQEKNSSWTAKVSEFILYDDEEQRQHRGIDPELAEEEFNKIKDKRAEIDYTPEVIKKLTEDTVDWSTKLPSVKDQSACGSCWIFSAVASLEYQVNKDKDPAKEEMTALSEEMITNCLEGCSGGWPPSAYSWSFYHKSHWPSTYDYRYTASETPDCHWNKYDDALYGLKFKDTDAQHIPRGDDSVALAVSDPRIGVVIAMVSTATWGLYDSGIFDSDGCDKSIDHAVVVTGYGVENGKNYFRIRNSWGANWGEGGYMRLLRGVKGNNINMCRVSDLVYYPRLKAAPGKGKEGAGTASTAKKFNCGDGKQKEYRGTKSTTKDGYTCQDWASQKPHSHRNFPKKFPYDGLEKNYCRNPDNDKIAWCYTTNASKRYDYCDVTSCYKDRWCKKDGYNFPRAIQIGRKSGSADILEAKKACYTSSECDGLEMNTEGSEVTFMAGTPSKGGKNSILVKGLCDVISYDERNDWCEIKRWSLDDTSPDSWEADTLEEAKGMCLSAPEKYCGGVTYFPEKEKFAIMKPGSLLLGDNAATRVFLRGGCTQSPPDVSKNTECDDGKQFYYRGKISVTASGHTCQGWHLQTPHTHRYKDLSDYPNRGLGNHNYCRNPDGEDRAWCYTTNPDERWEYCDVPLCNPPDYTKCADGNQELYRGSLSTTENGFTCQKWTSDDPHSHSRKPEKYPGKGLGDHNYCRNPDNEARTWCYTTDDDKRWDYCKVPKCTTTTI